jgi:hypothetical protein
MGLAIDIAVEHGAWNALGDLDALAHSTQPVAPVPTGEFVTTEAAGALLYGALRQATDEIDRTEARARRLRARELVDAATLRRLPGAGRRWVAGRVHGRRTPQPDTAKAPDTELDAGAHED